MPQFLAAMTVSRHMPTITALTLYPVKSCAGIALDAAEVAATGLRFGGIHDREWMIVDAAGQFLTQRELPQMATIRPILEDNQYLLLQAPNIAPLRLNIDASRTPATIFSKRQVQVWDDVLMADSCGTEADDWCTRVLGVACHLVRFDPNVQRPRESQWLPGATLTTLFSDGFPMLLVSTASLADLNQKLVLRGNHAVPMDRFRPNIVIDGVDAFEEDYAESLTVITSQKNSPLVQQGIILKPVKPCPRCPIPAVNQLTGLIESNPVDTLQTYHTHARLENAATFGMNTIVVQGQNRLIRVGDKVTLQIAF